MIRSSLLLPPVLLWLAVAACDRDETSRISASTRIATSEATPASVTPAGTADAQTLTFEIQTTGSSASFTVEEEFFARALDRLGIDAGIIQATGVTQDVAGRLELRIAGDAVTVVGGSFTANLFTLTTDQRRRDKTLRKRFLESASFPLAHFVITRVSNFPESYTSGETIQFQMTGEMKIREVTRELTFEVSTALSRDALTGTARAFLYMADYGITPPSFLGLLKVKDGVKIEVVFAARRSAARIN